MPSKAKPDIIWILIDGVRPDKLKSCGNLKRPLLFLDEILLKGTLLTKVISADANTKTSIHAAYTSLYPSINKLNAFNPMYLTELDPLAVTLTDILHYSGYKTFRYQDVVKWQGMVDIEQSIPTSGFDIWESSGYRRIGDTPRHSFSTIKRDAFITEFNQTPSPKFAFIHLWTFHDLNCEGIDKRLKAAGYFGPTSELYENNLLEASEDFKDVWDKLQLTNENLVVVSTDHGARLDFPSIYEEEQQYGVRLRDISMNTFCSFIGFTIPRQIINNMVRMIDIVPTILEIASCEQLLGQGRSLLPLIRGEKFSELHAFMETGGIYEKPSSTDESNVWGVRTEKWKYWKHVSKGEWLIDLENDPEEEINLIGKDLPIKDYLQRLVQEYINDNRTPEQIYAEKAQAKGISRYFMKRQIVPEVSLFLLVQKENPHLADIIDSILAQICVYFELIIVDTTPDDRAKIIVEKLQDYRISYKKYKLNTSLTSIISNARGKYISCISPDIIYKPYFLYELRNILRSKSEIALVYSNYIYIDQVGFEKIINAEKIFKKKSNIGYCFFARKEAISKMTPSGTKIFNNDNLCLPLIEDSLIFHTSQSFGYRYHRAGIYTLGLHFLYKVIDVGRKKVIRQVMNLIKIGKVLKMIVKRDFVRSFL